MHAVPMPVPVPEPRVPGFAITAAVLACTGALPWIFFIWLLDALAREIEGHSYWWLYPFLAVPAALFGGTVWLLCRRHWLPLAIACGLASAMFFFLVYEVVVDDVTAVFPLYAAPPLLALPFVVHPSVRRWAAQQQVGPSVAYPG